MIESLKALSRVLNLNGGNENVNKASGFQKSSGGHCTQRGNFRETRRRYPCVINAKGFTSGEEGESEFEEGEINGVLS
jgi:hypothetical protein